MVWFIDKLIQLKKGTNDRIIIQGNLFGQKACVCANHGLHHVLIYTYHCKIQRFMQRLLLTASRSLQHHHLKVTLHSKGENDHFLLSRHVNYDLNPVLKDFVTIMKFYMFSFMRKDWYILWHEIFSSINDNSLYITNLLICIKIIWIMICNYIII